MYEFPFFFICIILIRILQSLVQVLFANQLKQEIKMFLMNYVTKGIANGQFINSTKIY